jgi:hypothetical protein
MRKKVIGLTVGVLLVALYSAAGDSLKVRREW